MGYLSPPPSPAPVIVYKDVGGLVSDYEAQTEVYRRENREVRLHECRSACTLALSLPNVCVYPDAKVKFHQAYNAITREADYGVSAQLFSTYPSAVQARLGTLSRPYKILTGTELIALGMRNCNNNNRDDGRVLIAARKPTADPILEIAHSVRAAIAGALQRPEETPNAPIRVAIVDRKPVPSALTKLSGDGGMEAAALVTAPPGEFGSPPRLNGNLKIDVGYGDIPTPPRRPPSIAFSTRETLPPLALAQLIKGAQPVLADTQFAPREVAVRWAAD